MEEAEALLGSIDDPAALEALQGKEALEEAKMARGKDVIFSTEVNRMTRALTAALNALKDSLPVLDSIFITALHKTEYLIGEELSTDGLVVTANYSDGNSKVITEYQITGFDSAAAGKKTVNVSYAEGDVTKPAVFVVTAKEKAKTAVLESISLVGPDKTEYQVGEGMNLDGLKVTAHYSDRSSREVAGYQASGFDSTKAGKTQRR